MPKNQICLQPFLLFCLVALATPLYTQAQTALETVRESLIEVTQEIANYDDLLTALADDDVSITNFEDTLADAEAALSEAQESFATESYQRAFTDISTVEQILTQLEKEINSVSTLTTNPQTESAPIRSINNLDDSTQYATPLSEIDLLFRVPDTEMNQKRALLIKLIELLSLIIEQQ